MRPNFLITRFPACVWIERLLLQIGIGSPTSMLHTIIHCAQRELSSPEARRSFIRRFGLFIHSLYASPCVLSLYVGQVLSSLALRASDPAPRDT
jgi:hypothetical protein